MGECLPISNPPAIHGETVAGAQAALRKRIRELAKDLSRNTFDIAEAFFQAQETRCYLEWGFESMGEYSELELGIKHRRAQYLAHIVRVMRACGVPRKDYEPVGVTKLREITTLRADGTFFNPDTKEHELLVDHIVRLVAEAPENSCLEVEEEVARLKGMTGENAMVVRSYKITRSAWDNTMEPAMELMRKQLGSKGRDDSGKAVDYPDGKCLEYICREYLNDPSNYMEESDESKVQIEVPIEEQRENTNEPISVGTATPASVDSSEILQDGLPTQA